MADLTSFGLEVGVGPSVLIATGLHHSDSIHSEDLATWAGASVWQVVLGLVEGKRLSLR